MMKITITILSLLVLLLTSCTHAQKQSTCLENAMTQTAMNECAGIDFKQADAELNRVYTEIQSRYADDKLFLKKLKQAQLAWIKTRDADFEMQFPHTENPSYYGSVFPMCASSYKTELTLERVSFLKAWLIGAQEGNSCNGSKQIFEQDEKKETLSETCYHKFIGTAYESDTVELFLTMSDEHKQVTGEYNYLPYKRDRRYGTIKGTKEGDIIKAKYSFEYKGNTDTVDLQIEIINNKAFIQSDKKDKSLNLSAELKRFDCEA